MHDVGSLSRMPQEKSGRAGQGDFAVWRGWPADVEVLVVVVSGIYHEACS